MTYEKMVYAPLCAKSTCFGFSDGKCAILCDNNFGKRLCPFFKTQDQMQQQEINVKERIKAIRKARCGGNGQN